MSIDDYVNEFASSAVAQHDAIWLDADARKADQFADKVNRAFEFLRSQGDVGRNALMRLFFDSRPEVRVSAAAYLLRHCTPKLSPCSSGKPQVPACQLLRRHKQLRGGKMAPGPWIHYRKTGSGSLLGLRPARS